MRPGEQARRDEHDRETADRRQRGAAEIARGGASDNEDRQGRRRARQQSDADETAGPKSQRKQDFRQPLVRGPGLAGEAGR